MDLFLTIDRNGHPWHLIAKILVYKDILGIEYFLDKIMAIVLKYGNFGKYGRKEQEGGWKHSIETGLRSIRHITQFFWLSPSENFLMLPKLISNSLKKNIATD